MHRPHALRGRVGLKAGDDAIHHGQRVDDQASMVNEGSCEFVDTAEPSVPPQPVQLVDIRSYLACRIRAGISGEPQHSAPKGRDSPSDSTFWGTCSRAQLRAEVAQRVLQQGVLRLEHLHQRLLLADASSHRLDRSSDSDTLLAIRNLLSGPHRPRGVAQVLDRAHDGVVVAEQSGPRAHHITLEGRTVQSKASQGFEHALVQGPRPVSCPGPARRSGRAG